jgi:hypothetical protein
MRTALKQLFEFLDNFGVAIAVVLITVVLLCACLRAGLNAAAAEPRNETPWALWSKILGLTEKPWQGGQASAVPFAVRGSTGRRRTWPSRTARVGGR